MDVDFSKWIKGRTIRKVMGGGGGGPFSTYIKKVFLLYIKIGFFYFP